MNIDCSPLSVFSWSFDLSSSSAKAHLRFNWLTEQGFISIDGDEFEVTKQGVFSGQWQLEQDGKVLYQASKNNLFTRKFEITGPAEQAILEPAGLGRTMILSGPNVSLTISPKHCFTRRAVISGQSDDFTQAAFAFWLTALTWKRQANSS